MKINMVSGGILKKLAVAAVPVLCLALAGCGGDDMHGYDPLFGPPPDGTRGFAQGTGFLVNDQGDILTGAFRFEQCSEIRVVGQGIPAQQATLVAFGEENISLSLLHIAQKDTPSLVISPSWNGYKGMPKVAGLPLMIAGFPDSNLSLVPSHTDADRMGTIHIQIVTRGSAQNIDIVSPEQTPNWPAWELLGAPSGPDFAGGPVFDPAHRVIGIVLGGDAELTIARVSDDMLAYLGAHNIPTVSGQNKENDYRAIVRVSCYSK